MQNNKTCFFYVLYSDKTWVFDQSERTQGPIYILTWNISFYTRQYFYQPNSKIHSERWFFVSHPNASEVSVIAS